MKLKLTSKQSFYWLPSCLIDKYSKYPSVIYHDIIPHCYRRIWHPGSSCIQHIFNGSGLGKFPILEFRSSRSVKHCFSNHKSLKYLKGFFSIVPEGVKTIPSQAWIELKTLQRPPPKHCLFLWEGKRYSTLTWEGNRRCSQAKFPARLWLQKDASHF